MTLMKMLMYRSRRCRVGMWAERAVVVKQKLRALQLAAAGFSVMVLFTALNVAAAPYANASVNNLWVDSEVVLTPIYDAQDSSHLIGYVLTGYDKTTVCELDLEAQSYTCIEVKLPRDETK